MVYERRKVTAKLKSISMEEKRTIFVFENPKGPEAKELKVSCFDPGVPKLDRGKTYYFIEELVPMRGQGNEGKFYHNLARKGRDGEYLIKEHNEDPEAYIDDNPEPKKDTPVSTVQPKPSSQSTQNDYWIEKGKREGEKERYDRENIQPRIIRQSSISSASRIVAVLISNSDLTPESIADLTLFLAKRFEDYVYAGELRPKTDDAPSNSTKA